MKSKYYNRIEKVIGNDTVSIAEAMRQLREFRALHPAPPPPPRLNWIPGKSKRGKSVLLTD